MSLADNCSCYSVFSALNYTMTIVVLWHSRVNGQINREKLWQFLYSTNFLLNKTISIYHFQSIYINMLHHEFIHQSSFPTPPMPPALMNFVVFPPGCGYSVADFWGWDAHEARLCRPDEVSGDMCEDEVPGWALKSKSTNYPDHGHHGDLTLPGKIPMVVLGIEPGTSWLVVRNLHHYTTRLVSSTNLSSINPYSKVTCRLVQQDFAKLGE